MHTRLRGNHKDSGVTRVVFLPVAALGVVVAFGSAPSFGQA